MLSVFILTLFLPISLFANNVYVAPVQGVNVPQKETDVIRELIKLEVEKDPDFQLTDRMDQASHYLKTKLLFYRTYSLSTSLWQGDRIVSQGQWKANTTQDVEAQLRVAVAETLKGKNQADGVVGNNSPSKSLGEQAAEKQQRANFQRVAALRQVLVGFGPAYFSKMNNSESGIGFTAGYVWNVDESFDLGLKTDFAFSTSDPDAYLAAAQIFTNYYFLPKDISPFVGAGFGYGFSSIDEAPGITDRDASGFVASAQAGVKFFRTSTVNLLVAGEYTQIFGDNSLGQPGVFLFRVGLLY